MGGGEATDGEMVTGMKRRGSGRNTKCMSKMSEDDTSLEDYERKGRLSGKKLSGAWQV